jgi:hypothetical protein
MREKRRHAMVAPMDALGRERVKSLIQPIQPMAKIGGQKDEFETVGRAARLSFCPRHFYGSSGDPVG